jgi:hypothetical protein
MIAPADEYRVGYGRPPRHTRWKKGQSGNPGRRKSKPPESTIEILDRLLLSPVKITLNGEPTKVPALEAIMCQLLQQARSGSGRAIRVLLRYQELADQFGEKELEVAFVDNEYTRALVSQSGGGDDA